MITGGLFVSGMVMALFINWAIWSLTGWPAVYCLTRPALVPAMEWLGILKGVLIVWLIAAGIWDGWRPMSKVALVLVMVYLVPDMGHAAFSLGSGCSLLEGRKEARKPKQLKVEEPPSASKPSAPMVEARAREVEQPTLDVPLPVRPPADRARTAARDDDQPCFVRRQDGSIWELEGDTLWNVDTGHKVRVMSPQLWEAECKTWEDIHSWRRGWREREDIYMRVRRDGKR